MENIENQEIYLKIPKNRIGVVIGKNAKDKKELENLTQAKINVDSTTGDITLIRNKSDPFTFYRLEKVIKAIGRGFSPAHAKLLLDNSYSLEIIDLKDFNITSEKAQNTKRGRIIGRQGSMKKYLEDNLDCVISVQGKTISVIGNINKMNSITFAIDSLLSGANIPSVKNKIKKELMRGSEW